jgi:type I restriction enzyme S subunit
MSGATTGKIATNQSDTNYYINQRVGKFVPEEDKLLSEYLYFVLEANSEVILKMSEGGAQPNLSSEDIKKMAIPVPPIEVQKAIAVQMGKFKDDSIQLRDRISSEIELRKAQYEYYRDKLLTFEEAT